MRHTAGMLAIAILACALCLPAHAEMLEFATPQGVKSWPKLPTLADWHQDEQVSLNRGVNFLVPDGSDTATAEMTISAEGVSRQTGTADIPALMERDKTATATTEITSMPAVRDKDGVSFQLYAFAPGGGSSRWQVVAYAEEGDYLLAFRLNASSTTALEKGLPIFTGMIQKYAKEIPW